MYDVDEDGCEEFASVWMIASKMVMCDGRMMKGKEKRVELLPVPSYFCKQSCGKRAELW